MNETVKFTAVLAKDFSDYKDYMREHKLKDCANIVYKYISDLSDLRGVRWNDKRLTERSYENRSNYEIEEKLNTRMVNS